MTRPEYGAAYEIGLPQTVRFLLSRGAKLDEAEEAAQSAWVKGWERLGQLRDATAVVWWVNSIAKNQFRSKLDDQLRYPSEELSDTERELTVPPSVNVTDIDLYRKLLECLPQHQMVLVACMEGCSYEEIARMTHKSLGQVRGLVYRAHRAVREKLAA